MAVTYSERTAQDRSVFLADLANNCWVADSLCSDFGWMEVDRWWLEDRIPVDHWRREERSPVDHWWLEDRSPVDHWRREDRSPVDLEVQGDLAAVQTVMVQPWEVFLAEEDRTSFVVEVGLKRFQKREDHSNLVHQTES